MNIFALCNRGIALSGVNERTTAQLQQERDDAVSATRAKWLNALLVDETRAWLAIDSRDRSALTGLIAVLTLAGIAKSFDDHADALEVRIIRGAISAAQQCGQSADCVISVADAKAFHSAAGAAAEIIKTCTASAIVHAAEYLHRVAGSGAFVSPTKKPGDSRAISYL